MARVAFIVDTDYEDREFRKPLEALRDDGHTCTVVGLEKGKTIEAKKGESRTQVQLSAKEAKPDDFDALVIPGGYSPDHLRMDENAVQFTRAFFEREKPVAAICHAGQLLIEAGVVKGKTLTSWPSVKTDLENAGATWVDEQVVEDGNLITSRKPDDLPAFIAAFEKRLT